MRRLVRRSGPGRIRRRAGTAVLGLLALASVAVLVVSAVQLDGFGRRQQDRDDMLGTARQAAVAFTSYDHRDLDRSFAAVLALATDSFQKRFNAASAQLRPLIAQKQATARGNVLAAGVERYAQDQDTASVLAAVDATVTNTEFPKGALQRFRLRLTLKRQGSAWRVDEITPVV